MLASSHGQQGTEAVHGVSGECHSLEEVGALGLFRADVGAGRGGTALQEGQPQARARPRGPRRGPGSPGSPGEPQDPWAHMRAAEAWAAGGPGEPGPALRAWFLPACVAAARPGCVSAPGDPSPGRPGSLPIPAAAAPERRASQSPALDRPCPGRLVEPPPTCTRAEVS